MRIALVLCGIVLVSCSRAISSSPLPSDLSNGAPALGTKSSLGFWFGRQTEPNVFHFRHLFSFNGIDGANSRADLLNVKGLLYGTTVSGGASGDGTVFTITPSGHESVLYSFKGGTDGAAPFAGLTDAKGLLYGTTYFGGAGSGQGNGTVFTITPSGHESVLYSFHGDTDGAAPLAGLTNLKGLLYDTTSSGGASNAGTVFTITPSGYESVLYSFKGGTDGADPQAGLIAVNGLLYGTTLYGGISDYGTVFTIAPSGYESVLYSFNGGADGANPQAALLNMKGKLYGTTSKEGGAPTDSGTVFTITPSGYESVLYSFKGGTDGATPLADLTDVKGLIYGTTYSGGASNAGTVFTVTPAGYESVLLSFTDGADGGYPYAGLTDVKGKLYGTTFFGGGGYRDGTVFTVSP